MLPPECPLCGELAFGSLGVSLDLASGQLVNGYLCRKCDHRFFVPVRCTQLPNPEK